MLIANWNRVLWSKPKFKIILVLWSLFRAFFTGSNQKRKRTRSDNRQLKTDNRIKQKLFLSCVPFLGTEFPSPQQHKKRKRDNRQRIKITNSKSNIQNSKLSWFCASLFRAPSPVQTKSTKAQKLTTENRQCTKTIASLLWVPFKEVKNIPFYNPNILSSDV